MIRHLKKIDWFLIGSVVILFTLGLFTIYASPEGGSGFYKQLLFSFISLAIIIAVSFTDYRIFQTNTTLLMILYVLGLASLFILLVAGSQVRGVSSWFFIGDLAVQPVELVKVVLILVLAKYLSRRHIELYRLRNIFISGLYIVLPAALVIAQPDLGSALVLIFLWVGLIVISGVRLKQFLIVLILGIFIAVLLWSFVLHDYQKDRVLSFINPEKDPLGGGYQTRQAIIAIGSGGFLGKGLGEGSQIRLGFLPEYQTDFIFAAIGEEWGFFGIAIILGAWLLIFWRLYLIWGSASNNFARVFVGGVFILFLSHVVFNIGANLAVLPVTGLPLPFVSAGGSNLVSFSLALGLVLSIGVRSNSFFVKTKESSI